MPRSRASTRRRWRSGSLIGIAPFAASRPPPRSIVFLAVSGTEKERAGSDEVDAIDADKAARVARLIFHTALALASADGPPGWTEQGRALIRGVGR